MQVEVCAKTSCCEVARLSPLLHEHSNRLGHYDFTLPAAIAAGQLRSWRTLPT